MPIAYRTAVIPSTSSIVSLAVTTSLLRLSTPFLNGYLQIAPSSGGYGPTYTQLAAEYFNNPSYKRYWDDEAKAPYLFDGSNFITYDDPESLTHKCKYIQEQGLAGIMFWEYSCDATHSLLDAMFQAFHS